MDQKFRFLVIYYWNCLFIIIFRFGIRRAPMGVPERLAERPRCPGVNTYVDEAQQRITFTAPTPTRPYKPTHLRGTRVNRLTLPDPKVALSYSTAPPIPPKPNHYRAGPVRPLSNRDDSTFPSRPPTLDEMINFHPAARKTAVITNQPVGGLRPGRHGFRCPRCRRCTCDECAKTSIIPCFSHAQPGSVNGQPTRIDCATKCRKACDILSCFCAVRACSYHVIGYEESSNFSRTLTDKPASCQSLDRSCALRWTGLTALTALIPCLILYPLFKSGELIGRKIDKKLLKGCQCNQNCKGL